MTNITSFGAFVDIWSERQRLGARLAVVRQVCARPHGGGFAGAAGDVAGGGGGFWEEAGGLEYGEDVSDPDIIPSFRALGMGYFLPVSKAEVFKKARISTKSRSIAFNRAS